MTSVDDIAHDDQKLKKKAAQLSGEDVILDPKETLGTDFEKVDPSVCAILVKKHGTVGAVRVFSDPVTNVETGRENGFVIVVIKPGQDCMFLQNPSVRYFRRRSS